MKKFTHEEVKDLLESHGCKLLSEYKNTATNMKIKCKCGKIFYKSLKNMKGSGNYKCNDCIKDEQQKKLRMPYNILKSKIEEMGYELLTTEKDYIKAGMKCLIKCDKGHIREQIPLDLLKGHKCKICATKEVTDKQKYSLEDVKILLESKNLILLSNEYNGIGKPIKVQCKKCKHVFYPRLGNILRGSGCPQCFDNEVRGKSSLISYDERVKYLNSFGFKLLTTKKDYINGEQKVKIECNNGHIYKASLHEFYNGNRCPICNASKGETKIKRWLKENLIKFKSQYRFKDCKFKRTLPFDFYLYELNICIEYDGKQHYEIGGFGRNLDDYIDLKIKDTIKTYYCKDKNIKLIRIPYWEFDNIETILNEIIINMK